ncbi:hypothetical protein V2J09_009780 [Rumex salicifolius]
MVYGVKRAMLRVFSGGAFSRRFYSTPPEHISFIKDVASTNPPEHLPHLLKMLQSRGDFIVPPGAKQGLIPLAIPLSRGSSGLMIALLRWPTAQTGVDMPVVEVHKHGVNLLAKNVDQYIHRLLVEEDALNCKESPTTLYDCSAEAGKKLYVKGDFANLDMLDLDAYLLRKVGMFPDVLERKIRQHLDRGDVVSALVTGEFYAKKKHFPGFGRPFAFNAEILMKIGRKLEATDAARGALKTPWWTLGCKYQAVAEIAQCENEQIKYIKGKLTEEEKEEALNKGKDSSQIAMEDALILLNLASVEGSWDECIDRVAVCFKEAGLKDIAKFVSYTN